MIIAAAPISVRFGSATDRGLKRQMNEDSYLAEPPVFIVADGMGGHQAGEVASGIAVECFQSILGRPSVDANEIRSAVVDAQSRIERLTDENQRGAGTTLTGVGVAEIDARGYWLVFNVGDSRTYRMVGSTLEQVSVDHSVVQEMVDAGEIDVRESLSHPQRNVITRALGVGGAADPDFWLLPAEPGDRMLVCSDGLTNELDDERIALVLTAEEHPQHAATRLVHEAMLHGGRDNLTVVVIDAVTVAGFDAADLDFDTMPVLTGRPAAALAVDDDTVPRIPAEEEK